MTLTKLTLVFIAIAAVSASVDPSALDVVQDMYRTCLQDLSVSCVKPKALAWMSYVADKPFISLTDDLVVIKKNDPNAVEEQRGAATQDVFDRFENFLQTHDLVAKVPEALRPDGSLGKLVPRSFEPEDIKVPLAATGRSKIVKKVIVPFLLGLKFKTAVIVPLVLALAALKTWKALTLGLLSLVITAALIIFKFSKPKVVNYEVIHYPQHVEHHVEHPPSSGWDQPGYGRQLTAQEMAYNAYLE